MAITYNVGTNIIQIVGYTEATPCNFTDIYNADKAGTLSIHDRNGIPAVDGAAVAVDRALRPADYIVLGGSSGDLYITVINWTNMTTATICITGTDRDGNAQTEDIVVNANGSSNTTKWFKTVTHTQVTVFTKSDSGSFDYELIQGQWGVVSRQCTSQFCFDAFLVIGDAANATWFKDTYQQIRFNAFFSAHNQKAILVKNLANLQLGELYSAITKTTYGGCNLYLAQDAYSMRLVQVNDGAVGKLYGGMFQGVRSTVGERAVSGNVEDGESMLGYLYVYDCIFNGIALTYCVNMDVNNTVLSYGPKVISTLSPNINKIQVSQSTIYALQLYLTPANTIMKNVTLLDKTSGYYIRCGNCSGNLFLINPSIATWTIRWQTSPYPILYRQYELDVKVQDKDENAINGATVKVWDLNNNLIVDTTTNASGVIVVQTLNYGYYNQAGGDTPTMQTPHTIQISKVGYETYKKKWTIDDKTDWTIALHTPKRRFDSLEG